MLVIAVMAAVFLLALDRGPVPEDSHFMDRHAGEPGLAVHMTLFYAYCGAVIALCGYQWAGAARGAVRRTLRTGPTMMAAGMAVAALYAALRALYGILVALRPVSVGTAHAQEVVTDGMLYASFPCWTMGVIAPATQAAVNRVRAYGTLARLHPLWRDLALAAPDLVRQAPSRLLPGHHVADRLNTLRDLTSHDASPHVRLGRYVGRDAEAYAQAYWIMSARLNMRAPVREPGVPAEFPSASRPGDRRGSAGGLPHLRMTTPKQSLIN